MPGIVTTTVRDAVKRIKNPVVLDALWVATEYPHLAQGTSCNENWHSWLRRNIPILGGVRSYGMLVILLTWNVMRFNEAVQANQDAAVAREVRQRGQADASAKADRGAQREKALGVQLAQAFSRSTVQPSTRRAYDARMTVSYDLDTMNAMGYTEAKPRAASGGAWRRRRSASCCSVWRTCTRATRPSTPVIPSTSCHTMLCCARRVLRRSGGCFSTWTRSMSCEVLISHTLLQQLASCVIGASFRSVNILHHLGQRQCTYSTCTAARPGT